MPEKNTEYKEVEKFKVDGEYNGDRDTRYITRSRKVIGKCFFFFNKYEEKYSDTSGADFDFIGDDKYRHKKLGIIYTRDRQKYG